MAFNGFDTLPTGVSTGVKPWSVAVPDKDLQDMIDLLRASPIANPTYESSLPSGGPRLGLRHEWLSNAKKQWETEFDWRKHEDHINSFPQFKARIEDDAGDFELHFVALFSKQENAIPILMLHGWPGDFLEFLPILSLLRSQYSAENLPYHVIVPSLPGYAFSSPPPQDRDFTLDDAARLFDKLASLLGFEKYMVQGGDVGGRVARIIAATYPNCRAAHLNTSPMPEPSEVQHEINESERQGLEYGASFVRSASAYAQEHATRPSTIGFVLSSSPLALLAWIGEKFMDWTDADPPLDLILESVTLYWLTKCASTSLWSYRQVFGTNAKHHGSPEWYIKKPFGFSWFPKELAPVPKAWVATTGDLVFYRQHDKGGHFAAMEQPEVLWKDVEDFVQQVKHVFD